MNDVPVVDRVAVYLCGFQSSSCCQASLWRICFRGNDPDRYVCQECVQECEPVDDRRTE